MRRWAEAEPSRQSTTRRQQAALVRAPRWAKPSSSAEGLPTAAKSAGHSAASILRATLTTTSANCADVRIVGYQVATH